MAWARVADSVVVTQDLDFPTILAATGAAGPSVVLVRANDTLSGALFRLVLAEMRAREAALNDGALLVVDHIRARVRLLPLAAR